MFNLCAIIGPTAVGKSKIAVEVADRIQAEIISADSVQIYKGLDIGSAKIKNEEQIASSGRLVKHHMIDVVEPDQDFSVADYKKEVERLIPEIQSRNHVPLLVGGTGLYVQAIIDPYQFEPLPINWELRHELHELASKYGKEYLHAKLQQVDPVSANKLHPNDLRRVTRALEVYYQTGHPIWYNHFDKEKNNNTECLLVGLTMPRQLLYHRINLRVDEMIAKGLVDEVKSLLEAGYDRQLTSLQSLGYKQIIAYLMGEISLEEAIELIKRDTRRFAKRQIAWFKRDKRINWYMIDESTDYPKLIEEIVTFFGRSLQKRYRI